MRIIHIMIGHKIKWLFCLIIICINGCSLFNWDEVKEYDYDCIISNATNDTLEITFGVDIAKYSIESFSILPNDNFIYENGTFPINEDKNPITEGLFNEPPWPFVEQTRVYINEKLVIKWLGPPREMDDSIHHFYNYNSWESFLDKNAKGHEGKVIFTIYESDMGSIME